MLFEVHKTEELVDKIRKLRSENYKFSEIRDEMRKNGFSDFDISEGFELADEEELLELSIKNRMKGILVMLAASGIILIISSVYSVLLWREEGRIDMYISLIPLFLFFYILLRYSNAKKSRRVVTPTIKTRTRHRIK